MPKMDPTLQADYEFTPERLEQVSRRTAREAADRAGQEHAQSFAQVVKSEKAKRPKEKAMQTLGGVGVPSQVKPKPAKPTTAPAGTGSMTTQNQLGLPMASPMNFEKGGKVKKTGLALVHEGETVVAKEDKGKERAAKSAMVKGESKKKSKHGKRRGKAIHIRRSTNGGYISKPEYETEPGQPMPEPEEHTHPDLESALAHAQEHLGGGDEHEAAESPEHEAAEQEGAAEAKKIPSMEKGGIVKETGPVLLHKGERVVPNALGEKGEQVDDNPQLSHRSKAEPAIPKQPARGVGSGGYDGESKKPSYK